MLAENVTQAVSADFLRGTLVGSSTRACGCIPMTKSYSKSPRTCPRSAEALRGEMQRGFAWSAGLPLMSEETIYPYYSKSARPL